jgi:hypothetical protein
MSNTYGETSECECDVRLRLLSIRSAACLLVVTVPCVSPILLALVRASRESGLCLSNRNAKDRLRQVVPVSQSRFAKWRKE